MAISLIVPFCDRRSNRPGGNNREYCPTTIVSPSLLGVGAGSKFSNDRNCLANPIQASTIFVGLDIFFSSNSEINFTNTGSLISNLFSENIGSGWLGILAKLINQRSNAFNASYVCPDDKRFSMKSFIESIYQYLLYSRSMFVVVVNIDLGKGKFIFAGLLGRAI